MDGGRPSPDYLTVRAAATRLGVHENTVRNWVKQGLLRSARPAGTRFHRFELVEVERVRQARAPTITTQQEQRRTIGPELVDASRLGTWADSRSAQDLFPRLVRRLLLASPGVRDVSMPAGDGVGAPGWDGRATVAAATHFLPQGAIRFELGVGRAPKAKADRDYAKRTANPLSAIPAETWFVFVTPRRWTGAEQWAVAKSSDGPWRGVRVIDGDDLEAWLESTPTVHYWISEQLGLRPREVVAAEDWWTTFSQRTDPALPAELVLAGRHAERAQLERMLTGPPSVLGLQTSWKTQAIAFACAACGAVDVPLPELFVVTSPEAWAVLVTEPRSLALMPDFEGADLDAAISSGKHAILPLGYGDVAVRSILQLPRPDRAASAEALMSAGVGFHKAQRLAALARRSMGALVRSLSRDPGFRRPVWASPPDDAIFAPLALVGSWAPTEADHSLIERLVGYDWPDIERALRRALLDDDPPFVLSGQQWRLASAEETFRAVVPSLTTSDLERWGAIVVDVLLERDPAVDLPPEEQMTASLTGHVRQYSAMLRHALAEGLALLGALDDIVLAGGTSCRQHAERAVRRILNAAADDSSGLIWRSLSAELPLLAEAAPDALLDSVLDDVSGTAPLLATMFGDRDSWAWLGGSSPHTGLLWALEKTCWSEDHLVRAVQALAGLAALDPGGRLSNRPIESLRTVLLPWLPQTAAPLELRFEAIDQVMQATPDVGWKLLLALWPSNHATAMPSSTPEFRDWKPDHEGVTVADHLATIDHVVTCAIAAAGPNADRWATLAGRTGPLPPDQRDRVIAALEAVADKLVTTSEARLSLWEAITREVARYHAFPAARSSMSGDPLDRLAEIADRIEPTDDVGRYARLFDWRPDIGGERDADHAAYEARLLQLQEEAVRETVGADSLEGLARLARRSPVPGLLGWAVADVCIDEFFDEMLAWLASNDGRREAASAWLSRRATTDGPDWVARALTATSAAPIEQRALVPLESPPNQAMWDLLDIPFPDVAALYWQRMNPFQVQDSDVSAAVRRLLDAGRPWPCIDLLAMHVHGDQDRVLTVTPDLVVEVLDAALATDSTAEARTQSLGYELGWLLDFLEARDADHGAQVRLEWFFFRHLEDHREPRALYTALGEQPELFVELVSRVYRGKGEARRTLDENSQALAQHAWWVLNAWRRVPGTREDGSIDASHLDRWVAQARLLLSDADRSDIGDEQIGQLLSGSCPGADGVQPAEPVRDLIERIGSRDLETGLHVGVTNARGVTTRGLYDGGGQERDLAIRYRGWSGEIASRWPRTSRLLREIAEDYERQARYEDARAEADADRY